MDQNQLIENTKRAKRADGSFAPAKDPHIVAAEAWVFIAVQILAGFHNKTDMDDNWSEDPYLYTPIFSSVMPRDRFNFISRVIHFVDNEKLDTVSPDRDRFAKIRPILDLFNINIGSVFNLSERISVDESLMMWLGQHAHKKYINTKAAKWGLKFYELCCAKTGFVSSMILDESSQMKLPNGEAVEGLQKTGQIVVELVVHLKNQGYYLATDNFYTDIVLFRHLHSLGFNVVGTVKAARRLLPGSILDKKWIDSTDKGKMVVSFCTDFFFFNWMDNKEVRILASYGSPNLVPTTRSYTGSSTRYVPEIIHEYNSTMPGVDLSDQKIHGHEIARKRTKKWTTRFWWHLVDIALMNSEVITKYIPGSGWLKRTHVELRKELVRQILGKYVGKLPEVRKVGVRNIVVAPADHVRLTERHTEIQQTKGTRRCVVCSTKENRSETTYFCVACNKHMHPVTCFHKYHTA